MTQVKIGKLGADMIDTTAQSWARAPEDDPTSPLWLNLNRNLFWVVRQWLL
jgi:hypothetical protein